MLYLSSSVCISVFPEPERNALLCAILSGTSTPSGKKRSLSPVEGKDGWKDGEIKEERDGKRARVEGMQLEAQLELKITANAGSRLKLEKVCVLDS